MLPENRLSSTPVIGAFLGANAQPQPDARRSLCSGAKDIQDPSYGHNYQIWECDVISNNITISSPTTAPVIWHSAPDITKTSLAFDMNMFPYVAFVEAGETKLVWYDTSISSKTVTSFGSDVQDVLLSIDETRQRYANVSDIIMAYLRSGVLYYRYQRDRFLIEYQASENVYSGLARMSMNDKNRFQFELRHEVNEYDD